MRGPRDKAGIDVVPFLVAKIFKVLDVLGILLTWLVEPLAKSPKLGSFVKTRNKVFGTFFRIGSFWNVPQGVLSSPSWSKHVHHCHRLLKHAWLQAILDKNGLNFTGSIFNDLGVDHVMHAANLGLVGLFLHVFTTELVGLVFGIVAFADPYVGFVKYLLRVEVWILNLLVWEGSINPRMTDFKLGDQVRNQDRYGLSGCLSIFVSLTFFEGCLANLALVQVVHCWPDLLQLVSHHLVSHSLSGREPARRPYISLLRGSLGDLFPIFCPYFAHILPTFCPCFAHILQILLVEAFVIICSSSFLYRRHVDQ